MKTIQKLLNKIIVLTMAYIITLAVIMAAMLTDAKEMENTGFRIFVFLLFIPILIKYTIHLFLAPLYSLGKRMRVKKDPAYNPRVSVLVPAWNEEVGIEMTINSILASSYKNLELIVVNDGSSDSTHEIMCRLTKEHLFKEKIKYLNLVTNGGKPKAMNKALKLASGDIVVTTDADTLLDKYAIENLLKYYQDPKVMSVAGNVKIGNDNRSISAFQKLEYNYGFYFKRADSLLNTVYIVGGAAASYRKEVIDKLGEFDESIITEDIEYSTRILNAGYKIKYADDAIFYTEGPSDLSSLIKQRLRWKYGRLLTFYKYRKMFFSLTGNHSFFLAWLILPVALFAELVLLLEVVLLPVFYGYTLLTFDFMPLVFAISFLSTVVVFQVLNDPKLKENKGLLTYAPIAWLIFYFVDFVEYVALVRSIKNIVTKQNVVWQKWKRRGVLG